MLNNTCNALPDCPGIVSGKVTAFLRVLLSCR